MFMAFVLVAGSVATVHPSGPTVPENLLRIELHFKQARPAPMAIEDIRLLDAEGLEIPGAFLDLTLPSADGKRVTLLLHPARVKTGVGANMALGRALRAGALVTLVAHEPGGATIVQKTWRVTPFDAESPQPGQWALVPPARGSRAPLALQLGLALNASAQDLIAIRGPDGRRVPGRALLKDGETLWLFTPARPWASGRHAIVTHPALETPAGNRICASFETAEGGQRGCGDKGSERQFDITP